MDRPSPAKSISPARGNVDVASDAFIKGWCCGPKGELTRIHLYINGNLKALFPASSRRNDLHKAGISDAGGFQFDISTLIDPSGPNQIELTDDEGRPLPKGKFVVSGRSVARGHLDFTLPNLSGRAVGVLGDPDYAADLPRGSALSKILNALDLKIVKGIDSGDVNIWFTHPHAPKPAINGMINAGFQSAAKSAIDLAHAVVFDRSVCVRASDIELETEYVVKSEDQAAHDGRVLLGKDLTHQDFSKNVVQRLIDNRLNESTVLDIRVPYFSGEIPIAYLKTRPVSDRFSNGNRTAHVTQPANVLSKREIEDVERFCRALQIDYAELDILRDAKRNDIWIVDVNNTPSGPPNGLSKGEADLAVREMSLSFYRQFLSK